MGDKADEEPNYAAKAGKASAQSPAMQQVTKILFWKDVKVSGAVFGAGMVWFYMTMWGGYTVMSALSLLLILHLIVSLVKNLAMRSQQPEAPPQIDAEAAKKGVETAIVQLNSFLQWYWTLLGASNLMAALQVVGVLLCTWTIGSWFQFYTLLFLAFLVSFSVPVAYHANKKLCDEKIAMISGHVMAAIEKVKAKIPKAGKSEDGKKSK
mmetsp:Transcript_67959/g.167867  ORF Transcript_67959/g.167867 Transcript_67959/m.167867 type:complete len:209 (-) Transcript_67959:706-1332(-)|eukprot:CAMPEP_0206211868 /NCGR_PEP_ID=MMETSP0047_2-20121206/232_1 /ASSEMBLY_ACC=CAM_ASM_000192 /TAXON_ID=195065 /ORGANISM="Chroomonas mesostigmatica_cf, Strain CCMP1168" /LENGTH=208 /DNA_ID=CAMNT_0053633807 /DNA_START=35 /DNA_END=661 /DNA_ORIENTATION=-